MLRRDLVKFGICAAAYRGSLCFSLGQCPSETIGVGPEQQRYVDGVTSAEKDREKALLGYTSREVYTVYRGSLDPAATRIVRAEYVRGKGKTYTELERHGSSMIQSKLLDRLLREQLDLSKPGNREKGLISTDNYEMKFECIEKTSDGRSRARLAVIPRRKSKYLVEGHILIDSTTFHLVQVHGRLAERPTFWASTPEIVREYSDQKGFFLATQVTSSASSILLGKTQVVITYSYEQIS
jgi:hypothetical protein